MTAAEGSFVDLSYRGLALARRVKLTQVRPSTGYVEMPAPMPVGTSIAITTDDGVAIDAIVTEIHEQVGGSSQTPGMLVQPALAGAAADWWKARVVAPDPVPEPAKLDDLRATDPMVPTTIVGRRMTGELAVPELVDDGHNTAVMEAVDPDAPVPPVEDAVAPPVEDDGKRTMMMDAVDLAALGLDPNARPSAEIAAVTPPADDEPKSPTKKKRKKR
jgi:hypothetical protein